MINSFEEYISKLKKEKIAIEIIRTLAGRFKSFPEDSSSNRNAPFHKAFLNAFSNKFDGLSHDIPLFISLSSWLHGLNTTLGQSFFETTACILSDGEKKSFIGADSRLEITGNQLNEISDIISDLKNREYLPSLERENQLILNTEEEPKAGKGKDLTIDVFYETDDDVIAIELKTVKPNAGGLRGEKRKALEAKANLFHKYPNKGIKFYFGFPFDPTGISDLDYSKTRFLRNIVDGTKYLCEEEILLGPELWDFLSGKEATMQMLLDTINNIATPAFEENIAYLNDKENYGNLLDEEYNNLLERWCLYREKDFRTKTNIDAIREENSKSLLRKYRQDIIKTGRSNYGVYNEDRIEVLSKFVEN